jgi:two-component system, NtrC family, sensor histidine kinase HydH
MPASPPPAPDVSDSAASLRPIVDRELDRLMRRAVDLRIGMAPFLGVVAVLVVWVDPNPWRRLLVASVALLALLGAWLSARRVHRAGLSETSVATNFKAMALLQGLMILGTGGVESPLLPVMLPLAIAAAILLGRGRAIAAVVGLQVGYLLALGTAQAMGWLPALRLAVFQGAGPSAPAELVTTTLLMVGMLMIGTTLGVVVRRAFEHMVQSALDARDEQLRTVVGYARELEALSGEIAHELKNPLASIKGLSALLARDVGDGKPSERLAVMRQEIDRMQTTIEEFLTYSRPLSPLRLDQVDPVLLCRRVAALHEGLARARGVHVAVIADGPLLRGDERKLSQVLVNLLQNALDAAPPGSQVDLHAHAEGDLVVFEVGDRGAGLPQSLGDRVFEPGVSGKEHGSGLGLTIALGLARQHGGDLRLLDRPGGGTLARLRLPIGGPL